MNPRKALRDQRLAEAEATIEALLSGEIDAVVDSKSQTPVLLSKAQDALRESEERYRRIVETANEGIGTIDDASKITFVNQRLAKLLGHPAEAMLGQPLGSFLPQTAAARAAHRLRVRRSQDGISEENEVWFVRKDGSELRALLKTSPIRGSGGEYVGTLVMVTDRTHRDLAEEELRRERDRVQRLQETSRLKGEFLANMSHELRTPLNAIIGFTELMYRGKVGPVSADHTEYLGDILTSSKHLLRLINDVLDLAKVESGKMEFRAETVDLAELAQEIGEILRGLAASKRLSIDIQVGQAIGPVVVDPGRVKQILYNYLSNAIKFTPEGGNITVRITPEGTALFRIEVEDTGVGISAEDLGRLFIEFQQLDRRDSNEFHGTGLGLTLTKRIAEAHGGRVEVRSTPGQGSTFSAILPRRMPIEAGLEARTFPLSRPASA
jgi:PAS domain S-box-containing protein